MTHWVCAGMTPSGTYMRNDAKQKIAVVLFNLGGPDSLQAVKPFLFNLFNDKNIITLPWFLRFFIAKLISSRREKTAQEIYAHTGNKSPILEETLAQKEALKRVLDGHVYSLSSSGLTGGSTAMNKGKMDPPVKPGDDRLRDGHDNLEFEVFICMRHWHPMTEEVVVDIENYAPDEIIMLPLYPQFSTTTTASSLEEFSRKVKNTKCKTLCCYPREDDFINAHVALIEDKLSDINDLASFRMLFSAHGLPQKIVDKGDPYQWQIEQTVQKIMEKLSSKFKELDYKITYQSRVGPLKWLRPNTEDEIKLAGLEGKSLIIVPVAFVSEHVETLVELDIEYKKIADSYAIDYIRIPTLSTNDLFIKSLANMVMKLVDQEDETVSSSEFKRICPREFIGCGCG